MEISFIVPVYNEEIGVQTVIKQLCEFTQNLAGKHEIIIVNDGSTDKTAEILSVYKHIKILKNPRNRGYGYSLKRGVRAASNEWIAIIDADCTYPIDQFPAMMEQADDHDMVVAARTGESVAIPMIRRPAKKFINLLANYLVSYRIPDLNSGMRLFKKERALEFMNLYPDGFSFTTTITMSFLSKGYPVYFHPINYYKRQGSSKIAPFKDMQNFLITITRTILYFNPLKVFLPLSLIFFLLAVAVLIISGIYGPKILDATVMILLMTSFQSLSIGFLAELINKRTSKE